MFYVISKLFFAFARPLHFLLLVLAVGLVLGWLGKRRLSLWLVSMAVIALILISLTPIPQLALIPLETRFPQSGDLDPAPDGIIILGGAVDIGSQAGHPGFVGLNDAAERITEVPRLAALYPNARIIYTGGPDTEPNGIPREANSVRRLFIEMGIAPGRIVLEDRSLTTWENATMTKEVVNPAPGSRWLLVTSAFHMPRSVGVFRRAGWPGIIAYPTDYRAPDPRYGFLWGNSGADNILLFEVAAKEYFGLIGYWLTGRTSALFPAP